LLRASAPGSEEISAVIRLPARVVLLVPSWRMDSLSDSRSAMALASCCCITDVPPTAAITSRLPCRKALISFSFMSSLALASFMRF
jgi:hypothetical protein